MIHEYDIETRSPDEKWHRTNWGGSERDVVLQRAMRILATWRKEQDNPRNVGFYRTGVRVVYNDEVLWEATI